jgi:uncharacterized protein
MASAADSIAGCRAHPIGAIHNIDLRGPAGRLEALLNTGDPNAPFSALVCHPHPLFGGNLHNKVVYHAMKVFNQPSWGFTFPVLRFNFRGAGMSQGSHDGNAEARDVQAAVDWLVNAYNRPVVIAGFSFGASMALRFACGGSGPVRALALLGLPIAAKGRDYGHQELTSCTLPKLLLSGENDQFADREQLAALARTAAEPCELEFVSEADHFFTGQLGQMQSKLATWLKGQLA